MTDKIDIVTRSSKTASAPKREVLIEPEDVKKVAQEENNKPKKCVMCGKPAEYCMRGLPESTYCKPCAKDYFKLLGYLDKLK